jgi:hypothetical protein
MTTPTMRPELEKLPLYMLGLPLDARGYPIPWFVATMEDGTRDFRFMDAVKRGRTHTEKRCWVCGERRGANFVFVIGPMCGVSRISAEPPCHKACAEWSVRNCPFLTRPYMVRRENDLPEEYVEVPGMIKRNPGVMLLWTTRSYYMRRQEDNYVFQVGDPIEVSWWREGRAATREEVLLSMDSGMPRLLEECKGDKRMIERLYRDYDAARELMPR